MAQTTDFEVNNLRKICVVTGTRAEYGLLMPVMNAIRCSGMELSIIATAMHLDPQFGNTVENIKKDGFVIDEVVEMPVNKDDTSHGVAQSIGNGIIGIANALLKIHPDIVVVLGDRYEALAAAIAGTYMNIPIAHIHGGDSAKAGLDESARHAITKLSHIHFPATEKSAERIIKMGEDAWRVHAVGAPGLDTILHERLLNSKKISQKYGLDSSKPILLVVQHPVTTESGDAEKQMAETLEAIAQLRQQTIVIYPNADAGGRRMIKIIDNYATRDFIKIYKSIPHIDYLSLMKIASVLVGNSSSGIIESPSFCLPVVNIGIRQEGRERAENIIDVSHDRNEIVKAVKTILYDEEFVEKARNCKNPYGDGKAGIRIAKVLSSIRIDKKLLQKKISY